VNPIAQRLLLPVVPVVAAAYLRVLRATVKLELEGRASLDEAVAAGQYILAFWHSRYPFMPYAYPGRRMIAMVSRHRDAEMLVRTLAAFGFSFARGSTTSGGVAALRQVLRKVDEGYDVGFAPDGPRGPRRRVQPGVIAAARLTGLPILPVTFSATGARRLKSWDATVIPRPFSRALIVYGQVLRVPREADPAAQETWRRRLEDELDRITDQADTATGLGQEDPRPRAVTA
jgi:lysophospholipid acyltransferase (LPLAT)-like uncharacterized protein